MSHTRNEVMHFVAAMIIETQDQRIAKLLNNNVSRIFYRLPRRNFDAMGATVVWILGTVFDNERKCPHA